MPTKKFVLDHPDKAQSLSNALTTKYGIRFRLAAPGHHPYKVFWSSGGPWVEAVFSYRDRRPPLECEEESSTGQLRMMELSYPM
jgi:hypothetical protein